MRYFLLIVTGLVLFITDKQSCLAAPQKKSATHKTATAKKTPSKSSSKTRLPASVAKDTAKKKKVPQSKSAQKSNFIPLPQKKINHSKNSKKGRKIASQNRKMPVTPKKVVSQQQKALAPLLIYLNTPSDLDEQSSLDHVNETEMENQALQEIEANGIKTVRRDRAKLTDEDPILNENH